eukprot:1285778-Rhodomonas_salina.3
MEDRRINSTSSTGMSDITACGHEARRLSEGNSSCLSQNVFEVCGFGGRGHTDIGSSWQDGARDVAADRGAVSAELLTNDNKASWGKGRMEQIELCKWMAAEPSGQYAAGVGVC